MFKRITTFVILLFVFGGCQESLLPSPSPIQSGVIATPSTAFHSPKAVEHTASPIPSMTWTPRPATETRAPVPAPRFGTPFPENMRFSFSPVEDGTNRIAYLDLGLWIAKPDGTDRHNIFREEVVGGYGPIGRVVWSNDGTHLAFFSGPALVVTDLKHGMSQVIYHTAPRNPHQQHRLDFRSPGAGWGPNNRAVAFIEDDRLYVAQLEGHQITQIADRAGYYPEQTIYYDRLEWTADGKWILYRQWGGGEAYSDLVVISPNDPKQKKIVIPSVIAFALSRDGKFLAFTVKEGELRVAETACMYHEEPNCISESRLLTLPDGYAFGVYWGGEDDTVFVGNAQVDLKTQMVRILDTGNLSIVGSNPISPSGDELILSAIYDGGMTDSTLLIFEIKTGQSRPFIHFDSFAKSREAVWSPH